MGKVQERGKLCCCGQPAAFEFVQVQGSNATRGKYTCQKSKMSKCGFVAWAKEGTSAPPENPVCDCEEGLVSRHWIAHTQWNYGREFYSCPKYPERGCYFFQWLDWGPNRLYPGGATAAQKEAAEKHLAEKYDVWPQGSPVDAHANSSAPTTPENMADIRSTQVTPEVKIDPAWTSNLGPSQAAVCANLLTILGTHIKQEHCVQVTQPVGQTEENILLAGLLPATPTIPIKIEESETQHGSTTTGDSKRYMKTAISSHVPRAKKIKSDD